jgi:hypothetical protein
MFGDYSFRINNKKKNMLKLMDIEMIRIIWLYQRLKSSIRTVIRTPKWWYQRINRGYSDRDMWNADIYLAGIIAGTLQWQIDNGIGVDISYASPYDPFGQRIDEMISHRDLDYEPIIEIFEEYYKNGYACDEEWKKEFGGVLDKDIRSSVQWLSEHFTELWD